MRFFSLFVALLLLVTQAPAQDLATVRDDQFNRLRNYVLAAIQPSGLVRDSLVLSPTATNFHPATPDAAGFALLSLAALDELGKVTDAPQRVINILSAHAGQTPGVNPDRSADGHFIHFMNLSTGAPAGGGWDDSYSPISSALLVAGAQFAKNHFADNATIGSLADQLTASVDFNAAIHPSLDGRIFLDMTKAGGGQANFTVRPWNEYMLVESLALRQDNNNRAVAVKHRWLNPANIPKRSYGGVPTLTDNAANFAPAFWTQQMHFFNGDFALRPELDVFLDNAQTIDKNYSSSVLAEAFRYGLTAGVSPSGYTADRLFNHPGNVFSPEAVAAWGDMATLLQIYNTQIPTSDPRYRYGFVRQSQTQPTWVPADAGLVDHLFLLFGLMESVDPNFFTSRVFDPLLDGDYNFDGSVDAADYTIYRETLGSSTDLRADGNMNGQVTGLDYTVWKNNFRPAAAAAAASVPEPNGLIIALCIGWVALTFGRD
jgi:hypothetical protein